MLLKLDLAGTRRWLDVALYGERMKLFKKERLPEDVGFMDAGLEVALSMVGDNARESLRDGRRADYVADLAQAVRLLQTSLHEAVEWARDGGESFQELASEAHLSPEYLERAYERFDRGRPAQSGSGADEEEPWRVLG